MPKAKMAPVYIGDVGEIVERAPKYGLPGVDLSSLDLRTLCNIATELGHDLRDLIGVEKCETHVNMIFLGNKELPEGMNLFEHVVYCKNCWQFFRFKEV